MHFIRANTFAFLGSLALALLGSCVSKIESTSYYVDLQHGFEDTPVEVWADDRLCYKGRVTTESSLGFARHAFDEPCLSVTIKVFCDNGTVLAEVFQPNPKKGVFIGVNFDPLGQTWNIKQYRKGFRYY